MFACGGSGGTGPSLTDANRRPAAKVVSLERVARVEAKDADGYGAVIRGLVVAAQEKAALQEHRAIEKRRGVELAAAAKLVRLQKKDETAVLAAAAKLISDQRREDKKLAAAEKGRQEASKKRKRGVVNAMDRRALATKLATYERSEFARMPTVGWCVLTHKDPG